MKKNLHYEIPVKDEKFWKLFGKIATTEEVRKTKLKEIRKKL